MKVTKIQIVLRSNRSATISIAVDFPAPFDVRMAEEENETWFSTQATPSLAFDWVRKNFPDTPLEIVDVDAQRSTFERTLPKRQS